MPPYDPHEFIPNPEFKSLAFGHEYIEILACWTSTYKSISKIEFFQCLEAVMSKLTPELDNFSVNEAKEKNDGSIPFYLILKELSEPVKGIIKALKTRENADVDGEVKALDEVLGKYRNQLGKPRRTNTDWPLTEEEREERMARRERIEAGNRKRSEEREERGYA